MKAVYHLKQLADDSISMAVTLKAPSGDKVFFTRSRQKPTTLTELFRVCKSNITNLIWRNGLGTGHEIVWDEDLTDIKDMKIIGLSTYKKHTVPTIDTSDMVYEVVKVDDNWTVIKHDQPLLTWAEAVEELKKRI